MTTNTLGSDPASRPKTATSWLLPFVPMGFAAFSLSALVFFHLRQDAFAVRSALQHLYAGLYRAIGFAPAVMFFGLVILWSTIWLANGSLRRPLHRLGRLVAMTVMLGVLLNLGDGGVSPALHKGAIGAAVASALVSAVGYWPSLVLVWAVTFASLLLATDFFFQESFERMLAPARDTADDVGVEPVAADRLREERLAATASSMAAAEPAAAAGTSAAADDDASWRRRSWHERRAEREAMASRWSPLASASEPAMSADDAGAATEESAHDGFGLSAARVVEAIDAVAPDDDAVEPDAAEALQGDGAQGFETVDHAPMPAPRTPIVFPDEVVEVASPVAEVAPGDGWPEAPAMADAAAAALPAWLDGVSAAPASAAADAVVEGAVEPRIDDAFAAIPSVAEPTPQSAEASADEEELGLTGEVFVLADASEDEFAIAASERDFDEDEASTAPVAATSETETPTASEAAPAAEEPVPTVVDAAYVEPVAAAEHSVAIPRPEPATSGGVVDDDLVREAIELVTTTRRANTVFLQRKLRVDYDMAAAVLAELAARGIVALDAEATHGRVLA